MTQPGSTARSDAGEADPSGMPGDGRRRHPVAVAAAVVVLLAAAAFVVVRLLGASSPPPADNASPVAGASIGRSVDVGSGITVTVVQVDADPKVPAASNHLQAGFRYFGVEAKACSDRAHNSISASPWSVSGSGATSFGYDYEASQAGLTPIYPGLSQPLTTGQCTTGWMLFDVPQAERIVQVTYHLDNGFTQHWNV